MSPSPVLLPCPSQTVGPYFSIGLNWLNSPELVHPGHPGAVEVSGRVLDADDVPVPDAVLELWQADEHGQFPRVDHADTEPTSAVPGMSGAGSPKWTGWGRCPTAADGGFAFTTVVPGPVDAVQAPHADLSVFMRGLLQRLVTRIYFPPPGSSDPQSWVPPATDPVAAGVPADRLHTLVAQPTPSGYRFDVHLRGPSETVFFVW